MGTYSGGNNVVPEANAGPSLSHFSWFYPGNLYSPLKRNNSPLHETEIDEETVISVDPIRSVAPTAETTKNVGSGTKITKAKKRKSSMKSSNQKPSNVLKPKQPKRSSSKKTKAQIAPEAKREKSNFNIDVESSRCDFSGVPSPYCSCTGMARVCYKWGAGGWQSSCCTINISEYPLPMNSERPGTRLAGRKMSNGAYTKLLLRLGAEGHDLTHPVDLKHHWARHGTNKFVTIK
ncbi:protein BASIC PENTACYSTEINE7 [Tripterygium wilfordii]|uniref:GAGA-binding transcriptional activator n=1 Tax=Tripterygium wilfordii TaxID=458696 RepID=A0A7J7CLR2_TRIWF|nr:protein BASIC PENTACYSTEINE7-like [Tripterygium wilfordii]KAF5735007.1 protein BASIC PENTACYSTEINE7 [Tripterygium wilfordii]